VCGRQKELRRGDDPLRHTFRRWTTDEVQELAEWTARVGASPCPVCDTRIEWQGAPGVLLLRCFRCGNSNQWQNVAAPDWVLRDQFPTVDPTSYCLTVR
jgi:hypothetical protein